MGALDGLRVVDFGHGLAGPMAAMLLGDHGADVVRVDPPGGPRFAAPAGATLDRGKRRVVLDLTRAADLDAARRLVAGADVVVENFRPGAMDRLGLRADDLLHQHPHLVWCALPGFASDDPRAAMPAWEGVIAAATGTYWTPDGPRFTALPISSTFGALAAAVAIVMALIARERDGRGQRIEVPLHDATVLAIGSSGLLVDGKPDGARPDDPWGGQFRCADGRWVRVSLATFRFVERFAAAAGRADWIARGDVTRERPGPLARGTERRARLDAELIALFRARGARAWEDLGRAAGVPITMVRTGAEWLDAEHARAAGLVAERDDPDLGRVVQPGLAVRLSATPGAVRPRRPVTAPEPFARRAVPEVGDPSAATAALDGVRVVDLTQVLAGPTAARTLAEFGADVVKINNPSEEGAGYRWQVHRYHTDVNRGKRTVLLDLKQPEGLDVARALIARADVVLHNFRPGVAERLGVGEDDVRRVKRDVVYGTVGYCGDGGPWADLPGYEPNAQALTGMMARMAGATGAPAMQPFAPNDYATGLLGALAVGLGLFHRARTGGGQRVHTSLAAAATLLQAPYLLARRGATPGEPSGPDALGWSALQRLYRASDGWLFVGAAAADLHRLARAVGVDALPRDDAALAAALAERLATDTAHRWVERLAAAGLGAQPVISATRLVQDPWVAAHGLSVTRAHAGGQHITTIGPPARLSRTPVTPGRPASPPGADAADVLGEIGLGDRLGALVAAGVVALD